MTREPLTKRQQVIFDFVVSHLREHDRPPTLREIGAGTGITSTNGVSNHLRLIERKGYIVRSPMLSRGIRPVDEVPSEQAVLAAERNAYRDAFLKTAPWCYDCADRMATVTLERQPDPRDACRLERCDDCARRVRITQPDNIATDLPWASLARKEQ